jgi:hypothetical protein
VVTTASTGVISTVDAIRPSKRRSTTTTAANGR